VQLGAVGIEGAGEEVAPEGAELGKVARPVAAVAGGGGQGIRSNGRHDESCLVSGDFRSQRNALFSALADSFRRESLKEGFNCSYRSRYW
jgi:hypothetical protein